LKAENLMPVLGNGIRPVLKGTLSAFTFPFGETVVFTGILSSLQRSRSVKKVYLTGLLIAGFFITISSLRNIMVLGVEDLSSVYFPSYSVIGRINIGNFLQRMEVAVSMVFILAGFVKISVCLLAACKGLSKLFGYTDYRFLVIPVTLLMVNLSYILYENIMEMFEWAFKVFPYYALLFELILPVMIFAALEIKLRLKKGGKARQ
jgi:spore germination protein KB